MKYDVLVLGSGPAGLSAALCARVRNKSVLVVGNPWQKSPLAYAKKVDNYLGMPGLTGMEMMEQFVQHAQKSGADLVTGRVISLMQYGGFQLIVGDAIYQGSSIILAPGVVRQAKYAGEQEFLGRGVSYCATCDGMLYRGKSVVVIGRGSDAPHEAAYLRDLGCSVLYVAPERPKDLAEDISFLAGRQIEIIGDRGNQAVQAVSVDQTMIPCRGVFILRAAVAPTDLLPTLETNQGYIKVDRSMATNLPGVFAAGDCTGAPLQLSKAVGEGLIAALSAAEYLDQQERLASVQTSETET